MAAHRRPTAVLVSARSRRTARAAADLTSTASFRRGDAFFTGSAGVEEYSPGGQLIRTVPGTAGAGPLCFDPSGAHLILPGVGLFDSAGRPLPSQWASVAPGRCVADGSGDVFVATRPSSTWTITGYDLQGNLRQTFYPASISGTAPFALDLAPDECTAYYGDWGEGPFDGIFVGIGRFNVCTNTQEPFAGASSFVDDLRVLPDWSVLTTDDPAASLFDSFGQLVQSYLPASRSSDTLRTVSLAPDGKSFWVCCAAAPPSPAPEVFRFDLSSGQLLAAWSPSDAVTSVAVYAPPLLGDASLERTVNSNSAGTAEAFSTRARYSGQLTRLHLYADPSSTSGHAVVGVYLDRGGRPGRLEEEETISNLRPASWNYADIPPVPVAAGQQYWIAVLGPRGDGTLSFRDTGRGGLSETSVERNLTALPRWWSPAGTASSSGSLSAYGS
jgi:hypothetical protein